MALKVLQAGVQPLGQFDGLDSEYLSLKGGEVVTFSYVSLSGSDKAAKDAKDGYVTTSSVTRPAVTSALSTGLRPLFLADEGVKGYGTLFGTVVGGVAGQNVSGTTLGPSTATGSGKVTLWDKPGLYAVTLDACDSTASTGLTVTNSTLVGGAPLYATSAGLLTPNKSLSFESVSGAGLVVGRFVEFSSNGSLVTSPASLVSSLVDATTAFTQAIFWFSPETATYV